MSTRIIESQDCGEIHKLALVKGVQMFAWIYVAEQIPALLRSFSELASDPRFPDFTFYDAAVLSGTIKHKQDQEGRRP